MCCYCCCCCCYSRERRPTAFGIGRWSGRPAGRPTPRLSFAVRSGPGTGSWASCCLPPNTSRATRAPPHTARCRPPEPDKTHHQPKPTPWSFGQPLAGALLPIIYYVYVYEIMYMKMCICEDVHAYMCICMCTCIWICICAYVHMYMCICVYVFRGINHWLEIVCFFSPFFKNYYYNFNNFSIILNSVF